MKKPECFSKYKWYTQSNCEECRVAKRCKETTLLKKDEVFKKI